MTPFSKDKVKFAVVGCGHIGKRHAEMIERNAESELAALCDIKPRESLGIESYDVPFFSNIDEMLNSGVDFDVVNVCTPNGCHVDHSYKALSVLKHVVCEKPMGLTKASVERVIHKSLLVSRYLFLVMQNRYSPPSVWIKDVVDKKKYWEIFITFS